MSKFASLAILGAVGVTTLAPTLAHAAPSWSDIHQNADYRQSMALKASDSPAYNAAISAINQVLPFNADGDVYGGLRLWINPNFLGGSFEAGADAWFSSPIGGFSVQPRFSGEAMLAKEHRSIFTGQLVPAFARVLVQYRDSAGHIKDLHREQGSASAGWYDTPWYLEQPLAPTSWNTTIFGQPASLNISTDLDLRPQPYAYASLPNGTAEARIEVSSSAIVTITGNISAGAVLGQFWILDNNVGHNAKVYASAKVGAREVINGQWNVCGELTGYARIWKALAFAISAALTGTEYEGYDLTDFTIPADAIKRCFPIG